MIRALRATTHMDPAFVLATSSLRLVREQLVRADRDGLAQSGGTTTHSYSSRHFHASRMLLEGFRKRYRRFKCFESAASSDTRATGVELEAIAHQIERAHSHRAAIRATAAPATMLVRAGRILWVMPAWPVIRERLVPFTGIIGRRPINAGDCPAHRSNIRAQLSAMVHAVEQRNP